MQNKEKRLPSSETKSNTQSQKRFKLINAGLTDVEGSNRIAKKIMERYGKKGVIDKQGVGVILHDLYSSLAPVAFSQNDYTSYLKTTTKSNVRSSASLHDLERLCAKYLTSPSDC